MGYEEPVWSRQEIPFYDERYAHETERSEQINVNTANPVEIYDFLRSRVYKADRKHVVPVVYINNEWVAIDVNPLIS